MDNTEINLKIPEWMGEFLHNPAEIYETIEERMRCVIELSRLNVEYGTGGPFGAGIFDQQTKQLLSAGINLVTRENCSIFHAEIVAIMCAQKIVNTYDLGGRGMPRYEIVTSTEPCAMCMGAITWSGIRKLVCGARDEDARSIGFDEGPKPSDWIQALEKRGITVLQDVCRHDACAVLRSYGSSGGILYNGRQG